MMLEFITERKVKKLNSDELIDFIIKRVLANKIVLLEREFKPEEKLELMTRGLLQAETSTSNGINMIQIPISRTIQGRLRNKQTQIEFNLFAPGTSQIDQTEDGHYIVRSFEGDLVAEV